MLSHSHTPALNHEPLGFCSSDERADTQKRLWLFWHRKPGCDQTRRVSPSALGSWAVCETAPSPLSSHRTRLPWPVPSPSGLLTILPWSPFAEHANYFGVDEKLGPVAVSIKREKLEDHKDHGPQYQYRIIFRTREVGPGTVCLLENKNRNPLPFACPGSTRFQTKDILAMSPKRPSNVIL